LINQYAGAKAPGNAPTYSSHVLAKLAQLPLLQTLPAHCEFVSLKSNQKQKRARKKTGLTVPQKVVSNTMFPFAKNESILQLHPPLKATIGVPQFPVTGASLVILQEISMVCRSEPKKPEEIVLRDRGGL